MTDRNGWLLRPKDFPDYGVVTASPEWDGRFIVYGLVNSGRVYYVGQTYGAPRRLARHMLANEGQVVHEWVQRIGAENVQMVCLHSEPLAEMGPEFDAQSARISALEKELVIKYKDCMYNQALGWMVMTEEYRRQRSVAIKRARSTPQSRAKTSAALRAGWMRPETRAKRKETTASPEYKARASAAQKAAQGTPEARARNSARQTAAWQRPETRANRLAADATPEVKARRSAAAALSWADPEVRKRRGIAISIGKLKKRNPVLAEVVAP